MGQIVALWGVLNHHNFLSGIIFLLTDVDCDTDNFAVLLRLGIKALQTASGGQDEQREDGTQPPFPGDEYPAASR
jgi:hypothetical protein